jgi:poly-gamma-glutamate synthesis protein (capsule biosynthesis protein)
MRIWRFNPSLAAFGLGWGFSLLCSCVPKPQAIHLLIQGGDSPEREFLEKTLAQDGFLEPLGFHYSPPAGKGKSAASGTVIIRFEVTWAETENILLSRTWLVPRENPLAGRTDTRVDRCLAGAETLIPLGELSPPFVGLTVEGKSVSDEAYPLVRHVSVSVEETAAGSSTGTRRLTRERIAALETKLRETPKPLIHDAPAIVWITAAGDLMLGRGSGDILIREGAEALLGKTAEYFSRSDIGLVNLEGPVSRRGAQIEKAYNFRFDPRTVPLLSAAGIDAALLANNHVFDFGETAFLDTLEHLEKNSVGVLGAGRTIEAAAAPFIVTVGGQEIRIFGFASYSRERSGWDGASAAAVAGRPGLLFADKTGTERLKAALGENDGSLRVLLFHGGNEWTWQPDAATRHLYTGIAESGADLLIGSHPHTVQGFEWLAGKPMFWSLGNYVFAGMDGAPGGEEGLLIRLGFTGKTLVYFEPVPVRLSGPRSETGPAEQLRNFYRLSHSLQAADSN